MSWKREPESPEWQRKFETSKQPSPGANGPSWNGSLNWAMVLRSLLESPEGDLLETKDGSFLAVCPFCGAGEVIEPIPVIGRVPEEITMYLGCSACGLPFQVTGPLLVEAEPDDR